MSLLHTLRVLFSCLLTTTTIAAQSTEPQQLPANSLAHSAQGRPRTLQISTADVPFSDFASPEAKQAFIRILSSAPPERAGDIASQRAFYARYNDALAKRMMAIYPVQIAEKTIGGVRTEEIIPKEGVAAENRSRVLINLHGGAFLWGEGSGGEVESIPIASIGKIKVVTVAYRQGPEHRFPTASEDVAAVYRSLLSEYQPRNVGIYGCSAGGILTAEAIAWFNKTGLPMPGAIGTFCGSAAEFDGDSAYLAPLLTGSRGNQAKNGLVSLPYFKGVDPADPLVFPIHSSEIMAKFPPTLLIAGSRDFAVSSLFRTEAELTNCGVDAELHVWDGMWHAFFVDPDLPESKEAYGVVVRFFAQHLGGTNR